MNVKETSTADLHVLRRLIKQELWYRRATGVMSPPPRSASQVMADLPTRVRALVLEVSAAHGVRALDVCGQTRTSKLCKVRWILWAMLRAEGKSFPQIGAYFGRDHSTVLHGVRQLAALQAPALEVAA